MPPPQQSCIHLALNLEAIPFPISVTDRENRFLHVNRAFERVYGWRQSDLVGQSPRLLTPHDVSETFLRKLDRATRAGGWQGRLLNRNRTGRKFDTFLVTRTLHGRQGQEPVHLGFSCQAGAEGALLAAVIRALTGHGTPRRSALVRPPPAGRKPSPSEPESLLSVREWQVFCLLGEGQRTAEVADNLGAAFNTVRNHIAAIRRKLGCESIERLRALAAQHRAT